MTDIHVSMDIHLQPGYQEFLIDSERKLQLTFRVDEGVRSDVFLRIRNCADLEVRTFVAESADLSMLYWNEAEGKLVAKESYEVMRDAKLTAAYGELNAADTERETYVALRQPGANALVSSASLVKSRKDYRMNVVNFTQHTYGDMHNYAVVLKEGKLMIDAVGKIVKGASRSESHQTSRALSFEAGQNTEILPELLIDENDVQASHAMSIGRIDEEQMYYMQSRGLTSKQATALLAQGYLLPVCSSLTNEELKATLQEDMERKISELC